MVSLSELRKKVFTQLKENNIEEARADTDFLLSFLLGVSKNDIMLGTKLFDENEEHKLISAAERRIKGEPVQYITGISEFMSLEFNVSQHTLIPRADTEILVEECIKLIDEYSLKSIMDIGTGSGCIGLSILKYCKDVNAELVDISKEALKVAGENAVLNHLTDRVKFSCRDILIDELCDVKEVDLIVSNPPYIETEKIKALDEKVRCFEPFSALDGGCDGLDFYRRITGLASRKTKFLAFEIGYNQKDSVREIMEEYFDEVKLYYDYGLNPRVLTGKNKQI